MLHTITLKTAKTVSLINFPEVFIMTDKSCSNSRSCTASNSLSQNAANAVLGTSTQSGTNDKSTCIDVNKIYDSAKDKECIEDLRVYLGPDAQEIIDNASNLRSKCAEVLWASINVSDVAFNKGYYSVSIRYYFRLCFEACVMGRAREFCGIAVYDKQSIMFGGDGNVSVFTSDDINNDICASLPADAFTNNPANTPKVQLEVASPIVLSVKLADRNWHCGHCCCPIEQIPENLCQCCGCTPSPADMGAKCLYVTIGLFSLIKIERPVSLLINSAEYCIPNRESRVLSDNTSDPCELFKSMAFPTCDFYPASAGALSSGIAGGEGCKDVVTPIANVLGTTTSTTHPAGCGCGCGH